MIKFTAVNDIKTIKEILTHPAIYPHITDDFSPNPQEFVPVMLEGLIHLLVTEDEEIMGMFIFAPHNSICWEVHTCLLPHAWGQKAREIMGELKVYVWGSTANIQRVFTTIPETNKPALYSARRNGFEQYGINFRSIKKGGVLVDQILLGMSRPEDV